MSGRGLAALGCLALAALTAVPATAGELRVMRKDTALMLFWQGGCGAGRKPGFSVSRPPSHGRIERKVLPPEGMKCRGGQPKGELVALIYRPEPGFRGTDRFELEGQTGARRRLAYEVVVE